MKKLSAFVLIIALVFCSATVLAKSGDIAGVYYSTDIKTILNGAEISSINIGGQTLICAEDMRFYSFSVYWSAEERILEIFDSHNDLNEAPPVVEKSALPSGTPLGSYYETDIVTRLDGKPITAYNIGGITYILAEEMADFGYTVDWNGQDRILSVTSAYLAGYEYNIPLTQGSRGETDGVGAFSISYKKDGVTISGDANLFSSVFGCTGKEYVIGIGFYQNEGLFQAIDLVHLLSSLAHDGNVTEPCDPAEKYDEVNRYVSVSINGQTCDKIAILQGGGNGHIDFEFTISDIPMYKADEINSIEFLVGDIKGE